MKSRVLYVVVTILIIAGVAWVMKSRADANAVIEGERLLNEADQVLAQCMVGKASKPAKEVIAATFWGLRQLDTQGNQKSDPEPQVEARALQAIDTLANACNLEREPDRQVTVQYSFPRAWRLAELMTTDPELFGMVKKAQIARQAQGEVQSVREKQIKEAAQSAASWAVK